MEQAVEQEKRKIALQAEQAARQRSEVARQQEIAQREADFRDGILAATRAGAEADPFASIRGDYDLSALDSHHWETRLSLPGAERCGLIKTPAASPASPLAWTFGCLFRVPPPKQTATKTATTTLQLRDGVWTAPAPSLLHDAPADTPAVIDSLRGYEQMVKSVQSMLKVPYQPDERASNINQVFFADPSKPGWRVFVARINEAMIGVSVVAVQLSAGASTAGGPPQFPNVPTMLPLSPGDLAHAGGSQTAQPASGCDEYRQQENERPLKEAEVRRLQSELSDLRFRYQQAMQKVQDSDQQATTNAVNAQGRGAMATVAAMGSLAATVTAQEGRAEAQNLQDQISVKQSQLISAQNSLASLASAVPPSGCSTSTSSSATEHTVHDIVQSIRAGNYAPMPPAQRATVGTLGASGETTMTIQNSTAYELSVFFDGPVSTTLVLAAGASQDVDLAPGSFHVAGRVAASDILPFYGEETYAGSAHYSVTFYIGR